MRQRWICCKQTLRASSGLFVWLGACAVVSLLPGAWDSAPTTARSLVLIAFVGLTAFAYRIAVHFPDRVDARNQRLESGS